jgi:hypothetical protein
LSSVFATTLGNSWKNFPSSGVPSFAEHSCTWRLAKKVFLKNKKQSLRRPLPRALGTGFVYKNRKTVFADGLFQERSAQNFLKKYETPLVANGPAARPSAKKISKTVNLTPVNGYFFWPTAHCGLSAQPLPRAWSSGARQKVVAEKKFSMGPVPSATVGKACADGLLAFSESFSLSQSLDFQ